MKIAMRDGRVFQGTPVQIVQAMQSVAFGVEDFTLDQYIDWVVENARRIEAVELLVEGATAEERSKSLIEVMRAAGLAA